MNYEDIISEIQIVPIDRGYRVKMPRGDKYVTFDIINSTESPGLTLKTASDSTGKVTLKLED